MLEARTIMHFPLQAQSNRACSISNFLVLDFFYIWIYQSENRFQISNHSHDDLQTIYKNILAFISLNRHAVEKPLFDITLLLYFNKLRKIMPLCSSHSQLFLFQELMFICLLFYASSNIVLSRRSVQLIGLHNYPMVTKWPTTNLIWLFNQRRETND